MDREEYQRTSLENWQAMASGWERRRADIEKVTHPVSEWLVQALDPRAGDTVLELAAGPETRASGPPRSWERKAA
jgi:hypothetical protein